MIYVLQQHLTDEFLGAFDNPTVAAQAKAEIAQERGYIEMGQAPVNINEYPLIRTIEEWRQFREDYKFI